MSNVGNDPNLDASLDTDDPNLQEANIGSGLEPDTDEDVQSDPAEPSFSDLFAHSLNPGIIIPFEDDSVFDVTYEPDDEELSNASSNDCAPNYSAIQGAVLATNHLTPSNSPATDNYLDLREYIDEDDTPVNDERINELVTNVVDEFHEHYQSCQRTAEPNPNGRRRLVNVSKRALAKESRNNGHAYISTHKKCSCVRPINVDGCSCTRDVPALKPVRCTELRNDTSGKPRCHLKCNSKLTEADRQSVMDYYYRLPDYKAKCDFICTHVSATAPVTVCTKRQKIRTQVLHLYIPNPWEGDFHAPEQNIKVCRSFFLAILSIHPSMVTKCLRDKGRVGFEGQDGRGKSRKHGPVNIHMLY